MALAWILLAASLAAFTSMAGKTALWASRVECKGRYGFGFAMGLWLLVLFRITFAAQPLVGQNQLCGIAPAGSESILECRDLVAALTISL